MLPPKRRTDMQTHQLDLRTRRMLQMLREMIVRKSVPVSGIMAGIRGEAVMEPFENGGVWGRDPEHDWIK